MTARDHAPERLVNAYLQDLERSLAHLETDERQDVVVSVREHIESALGERGHAPTTADVEDVLRQLGPVEHIAHTADSGSAAPKDDARRRGRAQVSKLPAAAQYLLAGLILAMAVTASLLTMRVPAFFSPEGGDPVVAAQLAVAFIVFAVGAFIVKRGPSE